MNRITRNIAVMRGKLSDSLCHVGWGFMGQECDCGQVWPDMNWLARRVEKWSCDWDDDAPKTRTGRVLVWIGDRFYNAGTRLINGPLMSAYYAEQRVLDLKAEAIEGAMRDAAAKARDITPKKRRKKHIYLKREEQVALHAMWRAGANIGFCADAYNVSKPTARKYINLIENERIEAMVSELRTAQEVQ